MEKVLTLGFLLVFTHSFGQSLHPNYKAQLNNKLEHTFNLTKEVKEPKITEKEKLTTPKYRKPEANVAFNDNGNTDKYNNYKQHAPNRKKER